jgi:parallel beta-helix repeat protein
MKAWFSAFSGYYAYEGPYGGRFPFREFLRIAQPKRTDLNQYPFWDGKQGSDSCSGGIKTLYYGDSTYDDGFHQGLQSRIEDGVTDVLDSIMPLLIADSIQLGYAAQGQTQGKYYCDTYFMRRPTGSEMSMEAFIALSYGVKDIWYWPFGTEPGASGDLYVGLDSCYYFDRCRVTQAWERIQNHVTRNLQALSAYLGAAGMHWERSYDSHHIGQAAYLSSIYGWSDSPNPDSGWAQIGEFHNDSTGDKYILLVNRACSRDDIGTEAPDQHFVLRFNPTTIGSDYVFINDLAHTVHYDSTAHEWVGDSLVTYSAKMPDNKIPYTITLRAGEGKLLKIVPTSQIQLSGTVNTNYTYQGKISVTGDATVAGGHTMRIKGPARIEVVRCHSVKLVGNGRLEALGTIGDSVKFVSDTTAYCDHGVHPLPGDWYGIYINESASCSLSYCCVDYASYGIECRTASHVTILNTNVSNNETAGIYNYKGYLTVRYSAINGNGTYGVYGYMADNIIYGSRLLANNSYGIALTYWRSMDSTRIEYDTIASAPMVSQHGIFISSNDRVRIYKCKVGSYAQGGIHLYDSNALITNNDFSANQTYGIYADNYSFPKIRQCRLDTLPLGVKT